MHSFNQAEMSNLFTEDLPAIKVLECKVDLSHKYINNCSVVHFTTDIDQIQGPGSIEFPYFLPRETVQSYLCKNESFSLLPLQKRNF